MNWSPHCPLLLLHLAVRVLSPSMQECREQEKLGAICLILASREEKKEWWIRMRLNLRAQWFCCRESLVKWNMKTRTSPWMRWNRLLNALCTHHHFGTIPINYLGKNNWHRLFFRTCLTCHVYVILRVSLPHDMHIYFFIYISFMSYS